jgi:hypothetical protein
MPVDIMAEVERLVKEGEQ